jgi:hypothetical protein
MRFGRRKLRPYRAARPGAGASARPLSAAVPARRCPADRRSRYARPPPFVRPARGADERLFRRLYAACQRSDVRGVREGVAGGKSRLKRGKYQITSALEFMCSWLILQMSAKLRGLSLRQALNRARRQSPRGDGRRR